MSQETIQSSFKLIVILIIAAVTVAIVVSDLRENRTEVYAKGMQAGLEQGFDQGFISGQDYQQGVYARQNNESPERKNWYFWAGYYGNTTNENSSKIDGIAKAVIGNDNLTSDINPYRRH